MFKPNPYTELLGVLNDAESYVSYARSEADRIANDDSTVRDHVFDALMHLREAINHCEFCEARWEEVGENG